MGDPLADLDGLRAALRRLDEVLPAVETWPDGAAVAEEDRWMLRVELAAMVTGMAWSTLDGASPDAPVLQDARSLHARFRSVGDPDEVAAIGGVLDRLGR